MAMSRKHYRMIAGAISEVRNLESTQSAGAHGAIDILALRLSECLKSDNPQFDRSCFLRACSATE